MKVFFVSAPRANKVIGNVLKDIYQEIKELGYTHTSDLTVLSSDAFVSEMEEGKEKAMSSFYKSMVESISKADICVFEASVSSSGVGFLIDKALSLSKPSIILYYKELKSYLLPGVEDEKLTIYVYDENNFRSVLEQALSAAANIREKRFNFFINPKLLEYLETVSKEKGMTKSQFIRTLIMDHKRRKKG